MKRKALYLDDSEKELDALLENEDFWKPGKSEWDSEILDITNKQRELEESQYVKVRCNKAYCYKGRIRGMKLIICHKKRFVMTCNRCLLKKT